MKELQALLASVMIVVGKLGPNYVLTAGDLADLLKDAINELALEEHDNIMREELASIDQLKKMI